MHSNREKYLKANKRDQDSYSFLYSYGSSFLEKHKQLTLLTDQLTESEKLAYEYSLGVRDVLNLFEKPYFEKSEKKPSRFQAVLDEPYVSFLDLENHKIDPLPDWEFTDDSAPFSIFKIQRTLTLETSSKEEVITEALKLFPDSFLITFDSQLVRSLRNKSIELGILRKKDSYTCCLTKSRLDKAPCHSLYGTAKLEHLMNNSCYTNCRYLRDIQICKNFKTAVMRPFALFTQVFKSNYTPRTLLVIDQLKGFEDSLKSYFAFSAPSIKHDYFNELKKLIDLKVFKLKTYEKKGWLCLIEQLRKTAPQDERYPSFKSNKFEHENENSLYLYLKRSGAKCVDGLDSKDFSKYCELKMEIFKMNLALSAQDPYIIQRGVHTPRSTKHIWKSIISKYAKYTLIIATGGK